MNINADIAGTQNPVRYVDPSGEFALVDDGIAVGVGASIGLVSQGISDLITWEWSVLPEKSQDYTICE